ncbi:hypothetical protein AUEXF2481DRAFT_76487 [Aureobasidium subglaciale EXF-2481]|uniref:Rhodopsin domain-containing protein n=1 Tax=Aureobasidium subglaciale (strain EXF-2481) TaxID=1043005 RepID=A0A074Z0N0_AURSE|nr:uncharacterized protein AUEXF2481DRAFT_76487 [Aureobasidium subglaciale EXF-2481]KEQ99932.1 hypothetical protein AUEXF2481DRAFT_76487 [Aureobasidium subglaciale EXF-2481]
MSLSPEIQALLAAPALVPPTGITADFDNPPNKNCLAWIVTTLCMAFATFSGAYWCTAYAGYKMIFYPGYYVHQWNLCNGDLVEPFYLILMYGCAYSATLALVKTAILIDWCRFFVIGDSRTGYFWRISAFLKIGVSVVFGVGLLACIAASIRLSTTITFSHEADRMYFIGPLLFWACAEMTCGFFILSVPCMPSMVKHSGLPGLIDSFRSQGSKFYSSSSSNLRNAVSHTSDLPSRKTSRGLPRSADYYHNIDEEHGTMSLQALGRSKSQTNLRHGVLQRSYRPQAPAAPGSCVEAVKACFVSTTEPANGKSPQSTAPDQTKAASSDSSASDSAKAIILDLIKATEAKCSARDGLILRLSRAQIELCETQIQQRGVDIDRASKIIVQLHLDMDRWTREKVNAMAAKSRAENLLLLLQQKNKRHDEKLSDEVVEKQSAMKPEEID